MEKVSDRDALVKALEEWRDPTTNKLLSLAGRKSLVTLFAAQQSERETRFVNALKRIKEIMGRGTTDWHEGVANSEVCKQAWDLAHEALCAALATPPGAQETRRIECASCHKAPTDDPAIALARVNVKGIPGVFLCHWCNANHWREPNDNATPPGA